MYCRLLTFGKDLNCSFFDHRFEKKYHKRALVALGEVKSAMVLDVYAMICPYEKIAYKSYLFTAKGVVKLDSGGNVDFFGKKEAMEEIKHNGCTRNTLEEVALTWENHLDKGSLDPARTIERHLLKMLGYNKSM